MCVRFRDIPQIVASLLQVAFFLTPILWQPTMLSGRRVVVVDYNPFYHFVELIRGPLLGHDPSRLSWLVVAAITVVGWAMTLMLYSRYRSRIPYWV
jgi:ABC-type polysaccharide/polyol phosphate export permease